MIRSTLTLALLGLLASAGGQEVEFTFQLYRSDARVGVALEDRLVAGGEGAAAAVAKLPDFVRQGRIDLVESAELTTESGERGSVASEGSTIQLPFHSAREGLAVEIDPVIQEGVLVSNLRATFANREDGQPVERIVTTQSLGVSDSPMLLCRWQWDEEWLLLIGTATYPGSADASVLGPIAFYLEAAIHPSANAAKAERDRLASTLFPGRSGQRSLATIRRWVDDEDIPEDDQPGFHIMIDADLTADGALRIEPECSYIVEAGGRDRVAIREMDETLDLAEGAFAGRNTLFGHLDDIDLEPDGHVAAFRWRRMGAE